MVFVTELSFVDADATTLKISAILSSGDNVGSGVGAGVFCASSCFKATDAAVTMITETMTRDPITRADILLGVQPLNGFASTSTMSSTV